VPGSKPSSQPLATAALWPFGIALTSWHYMWRTTPLHRRERPGSITQDAPPPLAVGVPTADLQGADDGVGALFHRRYRVSIRDTEMTPEQVMSAVSANINQVAPTEFARFTKTRGADDRLDIGDEFVVRMPGPWNGPVRVVTVTPTMFRLATLDGHLEAGQIEFRAARDEAGRLRFTIESWARSGDRFSRVLYQYVRMAKEVQLHMWTSFLERVATLAGGRLEGGVDIDTVRVAVSAPGGALGDPAARQLLDQLHAKALNFNIAARETFTPENGWHIDEYTQPLPPEPPGTPAPGGSWQRARELIRDYEFADPAIVQAVYDADVPLERREMLLEARFHGLRFRVGVRVGGVIDETREIGGRQVRVWGWNYQTLAGHLEMGQIDYEVWKWLDTGAVDFHIAAFSRRAPVSNPLVRLGLRLFGRHEQVKFARRACERMARLTAEIRT
jgi:uncharacterized protein (UPF0548 family)